MRRDGGWAREQGHRDARPVEASGVRRVTRWRRIGYALEAVALHAIFALARALPVDAASALGGWIARGLGPLLPVSDIGRRNLTHAFPEKPKAEIERILRGVWDNLGRYMAEYPHLARIWDDGRIEIVGLEEVLSLRDDGRPGLLFTGHLANWELLPAGAAKLGLPLSVFYRPPNNPYADRLVGELRRAAMAGPSDGDGAATGCELLPARIGGAMGAVKVIAAGGHVGMLVDQRYRRGVVVPFFGRLAQTPTILAQLARRFDCPVHGVRVERLQGARFRVTVTPPLSLPRTGDPAADAAAVMIRVNAMLESWIRERPEQWLWLHRRWRDLPPV